MKQKIRPSIMIIENGKLLLLRYIYNGNTVYGLPGGNIEPNDTLHTTLIKELKEELYVDIEVKDIVFVAETRKKDQELIVHNVFEGTIKDGEPKTNSQETSAESVDWIDINTLDTLNLYPNIGKEIKNYFNKSTKSVIYLENINQQWY